jgi:hypothetical protein
LCYDGVGCCATINFETEKLHLKKTLFDGKKSCFSKRNEEMPEFEGKIFAFFRICFELAYAY